VDPEPIGFQSEDGPEPASRPRRLFHELLNKKNQSFASKTPFEGRTALHLLLGSLTHHGPIRRL
jgi:hypothetical protein